ncbi:MAG: HEAT repeat domain-containing protein [Bacteroidota bacterium]
MTNDEKQLIADLISGSLENDDFLKQYPIDLLTNKDYIPQQLEHAFSEENGDNVEDLMYLFFRFDEEFDGKYVEVFCKLLRMPWHNQHENMVRLLQGLKDARSVNCLYETALARFEYLDYDDTFALARKCIHALADINNEDAREKLKLLTTSDIQIIREKAEKQLL